MSMRPARGQQGLALPGRNGGARRSELGRGSGGRPCGDGGGPAAAPLAKVLHEIEQRPRGAGRYLLVEAGRGGDRGAEGG